MCVIAIKPKGVSISEKRLKTCWDSDPDGVGFMYAEDGKLNVIKGLMTFDSFLEAYNKINPLEKKVVIHFRFGTHGDVCPNLTHPFSINDKLALAHNGIFQIELDDPFGQENKIDPDDLEEYIKAQDVAYDLIEEDKQIDANTEDSPDVIPDYLQQYVPQILKNVKEVSDTSDSLEFCKVLRKLPKNFLNKKAIYFLLNAYVASEHSVVVFMDDLGNVSIVGNNSHIVEDGVWYSNMDYTDKKAKRYFQSANLDNLDNLDEFNKANDRANDFDFPEENNEKEGATNERVEDD